MGRRELDDESIQVPGLVIITEWWSGSPFVLSPRDPYKRGDIMSYASDRTCWAAQPW